jgi:hypothetical protein
MHLSVKLVTIFVKLKYTKLFQITGPLVLRYKTLLQIETNLTHAGLS